MLLKKSEFFGNISPSGKSGGGGKLGKIEAKFGKLKLCDVSRVVAGRLMSGWLWARDGGKWANLKLFCISSKRCLADVSNGLLAKRLAFRSSSISKHPALPLLLAISGLMPSLVGWVTFWSWQKRVCPERWRLRTSAPLITLLSCQSLLLTKLVAMNVSSDMAHLALTLQRWHGGQ